MDKIADDIEGVDMSKLICAICKKDWENQGSPALCPSCVKASCAIAVEGVQIPFSMPEFIKKDGTRLSQFGNSTPKSIGIFHEVFE